MGKCVLAPEYTQLIDENLMSSEPVTGALAFNSSPNWTDLLVVNHSLPLEGRR